MILQQADCKATDNGVEKRYKEWKTTLKTIHYE